MQLKNISVIGCGAATPIGTDSKMTYDMHLADIRRFFQHPFIEDINGEPIIIGKADYIDDYADIYERFFELGKRALIEAVEPLKSLPQKVCPLIYILLPEKRTGMPEDIEEKLEPLFYDLLKDYFDSVKIEWFCADNKGFVSIIQKAANELENKAQLCIAGTIDSYQTTDTLEWMEEGDYLLSSEFGIIPSEAAGFLLLAANREVNNFSLKPFADILNISVTQENLKEDEISTGKALTMAMETVLKSLPNGCKSERIFCDANGARYRTDELGFSLLRLNQYFLESKKIIRIPQSIGGIGVAAVPVMISFAIQESIRKYTQNYYPLICASSDSGEKTAILLKIKGASVAVN